MSKIDVLNPHNEFISSDQLVQKNGDFPTISVSFLIHILKNESDFSIYDLRCKESYARSHIVKSIHSNCSTNIMTKMSILKLKKQINSKGSVPKKIILYNQGNNNYNEYLQDFIENNNFNVTFLEGGFETFAKCAPSEFLESSVQTIVNSPTNPNVVTEDVMAQAITEIEPALYLGNSNDSENLKLLQSIGITGILCVTSNTKLHFEDLNIFEYKRIEASDSCNQNLLKYFDETFQFIEDGRNRNGKIFVHCMAGVSRSVTIVLAYLIKKYKLNVLQALDIVIKKRSIAAPNLNFLGQLDRYYRELYGNA